jgi:uncharacterized membrane protein
MITFAAFFRLLHIVTAIMVIAGVIGRQFTRAQAARTAELPSFLTLIQLSGRFERWLVIPGANAVFLTGLLLAWWQGAPLFGFLQSAATNWLLVSLLLYIVIYLLVPGVFLPRGKRFAQALNTAQAHGQITAELRAAFHDPIVRRAHVLEGVLMAAIVYLMVVKPF